MYLGFPNKQNLIPGFKKFCVKKRSSPEGLAMDGNFE